VGPCHHGIAPPRVAIGRYGRQIWRVVTNILNKQSRTADKGLYSISGLARSQQLLNVRKQDVTKCYTGPRIRGDLVNTVMNLRKSLD
jgi:hypothetical protein